MGTADYRHISSPDNLHEDQSSRHGHLYMSLLSHLFARCGAKTRIRLRDWLKLVRENNRRERVGKVVHTFFCWREQIRQVGNGLKALFISYHNFFRRIHLYNPSLRHITTYYVYTKHHHTGGHSCYI